MPDVIPASGEPQPDKTPQVPQQPGMPVLDAPIAAEKKDPLKAQEDIIPESKRFKEVYGNMKTYERQVEEGKTKAAEQDKTIAAMQEHNKNLQNSMDEIQDNYSDVNRPDPVENPEAFAKWTNAKIKSGVERAVRDIKPAEPAPAAAPPATPAAAASGLHTQITAMQTVYDDYDDIIGEVQGDINKDDALRNKIYSSGNPPKAAYKYGVEKRALAAQGRTDLLDQNYVEGGTRPPAPKGDDKPTESQINMARNLGLPIDKYMQQAKQINNMRK